MPAGNQGPVLGIQEPALGIEEPVSAIELPAPAFQEPLFKAAGRFVRQRWLLVLSVSTAVLIPCFWHKHIEAGDLGSHVYNAWLAELVQRGELSGLRIVPQWNNVAFDLLLSAFGKIVNWMWAERLAVSLCVLIFFLGRICFYRCGYSACAFASHAGDRNGRVWVDFPTRIYQLLSRTGTFVFCAGNFVER